MATKAEIFAPIHPGEILKSEYIQPYGLSANRLARALGVPANRITQIVAGKRDVTADTALKLAKAFGTSARFWLNAQTLYDLEVAEGDSGAAIERTVEVIGGA